MSRTRGGLGDMIAEHLANPDTTTLTVFANSGRWTKPAGASSVTVFIRGGDGSRPDGTATPAGEVFRELPAADLPQTVDVVVGKAQGSGAVGFAVVLSRFD